MKKTLRFFIPAIIIVFLSNNYSFGQSCNSNGQSIDDPLILICVNSGNTTFIMDITIIFMRVISMDGVMNIGGLILLLLKDLMDLLL